MRKGVQSLFENIKLSYKKGELLMSIQNLIWAFFISFGFVAWSVFSKHVQASGSWTAIFVGFITAIVSAVFFWKQIQSESLPSATILTTLLIVGILNAVAFCFYSIKFTDPSVSVAVFVPTVSLLMFAWAPLLVCILNRTLPSGNHTLGYALAVGAIYFLSK